MKSPELVVLGAGGIAIAGGYRKEGKWPKNGTASVVATLLLASVVAVVAGTPANPLISALVGLYVLAVMFSFLAPKKR